MRRFFSLPNERPGSGKRPSRDRRIFREENPIEVFVFPLKDIVFFPTTTLPLNIFEPRYVKMVNTSLRTHIPIALIGQNPLLAGRQPQMVSGYGYPIVLEEREDGTLTILLKGSGKLRLTHVLQELPFISCRAELIEEHLELSDASLIGLARLRRVLDAWLNEHVSDESQKIALTQSLEEPHHLIECMAALFLADVALKKLILETDDINDRIEILEPLLRDNRNAQGLAQSELN
jgi:Lon protease-like protein